MTKIAIVILNWNGKDYLEKFLPSVVKYSDYPDTEIYVADNNSSDDSIDFIKSNYAKIRIISFENNYGFARGYVKALQQISAEYFVLLNSDVEVTDKWLSVVEFMDKDMSVAAVMPKIRSYDKKEYFEYAGAAGGFIDKFGYPFCRGRILNVIEKDDGQYDDLKEIFWASGACMFIRSKAYFEAGGLDRDFFAHMEEIDLCWRLKILDYKIIYFPGATVYHVGGGTLPNNTGRKLFLNYRNNLYLLYKNLPAKGFYRTIFTRLLLDVLSSVAYLFNFSFNFFAAVYMAHFSFYFSLRSLRKKRHQINGNKNVKLPGHIYRSSIVYNFFLRKKRFFSELQF